MIVTYQNGKAVEAQAIAFAENLSDCEKGLSQVLARQPTKDGVSYVAVCTPVPPAPPAAAVVHKGETNI
jgi:hypothetical protein